MRRVVVVAVASVLVPVVVATAPPVSSARTVTRPNVVIIMTDDQRWDTLRSPYRSLFPNIAALMAKSTYFANAFVPNSLCCPSRVSTLTGAYSHTTRVYGNRMPYGGFSAFRDSTTIATAMRDAGYKTLFSGKYLNQYPENHYHYVPPGWGRWFAVGTGRYYNYYAAENGQKTSYFGARPRDYAETVITRKARRYVTVAQDNDVPYFLYFAPSAPHGSARGSNLVDPWQNGRSNNAPMPAPGDVDTLADVPLWRPASYGNKDDASDEPAYIEDLVWDRTARAHTDLFRERQLEGLIGVDRDVGELLSTVNLADTLVFFMSDNGFLWGEHRWDTKEVPYDEAIRVPMFVHAPGQTSAAVDRDLTLNIDVPYTIADAAGIDPTVTPIGTNSAGQPVLGEGQDVFTGTPRTSFVLEHESEGSAVPPYCGVRTADGWMYARYADGFEEMYDTQTDPLEQTNLAGNAGYAAEQQSLTQQAMTLCSPVPPGFAW